MGPIATVLTTPLSEIKLWHAMVAAVVMMALWGWVRRILDDA